MSPILTATETKRLTSAIKSPKTTAPPLTAPPYPTAVPAGYVELATRDLGGIRVRMRADVAEWTTSGGGGAWEEAERPQREPATIPSGARLLRLTGPVLFDGWARRESVDRLIADLERLYVHDDELDRTPLVAIAGNVPRAGFPFVIDALKRTDTPRAIRSGNGTFRQAFSLTLLRYSPPDLIVEKTPAAKARAKSGKGKSKPKGATVMMGQTLGDVAAGLGVSSRALADANGIRDPRTVKVGQKLILP